MEAWSLEKFKKYNSKNKKDNKFGAKKKVYKGITFDSIKEADYAAKIDLRIIAGEITRVEYQVPYPCVVNGKLITTYKLDFKVYYPDGSIEYIDTKNPHKKGAAYYAFSIRKKLVEALYGIEIKTP